MALPTQLTSQEVCSNAALIAKGALSYYKGDGTFTAAYWWQSGEAFTSLLNFQHICDNNTHEDLIYDGILSQAGSNYDFQPESQNGQIGNDDVGTWGLTVMHAAETGFKDPSNDGYPSWLQMAKNVYKVLYDRWDNDTCNGGLRWQFDSERPSYNYKATIANGNLFQLGARLARYTGDSSYTKEAESMYEWISGSGLVNELENGSEVYDGFNTDTNCTDLVKVLWTYNYGVLIGGSSYMYDVTGESIWETRLDNILTGSQILYNNTVLYERACETYDNCNLDQKVFKAVYLRYLGLTSKLTSSLTDRIVELISPSAKAAAQSCNGGSDGYTCGLRWSWRTWDGYWGLGEQLSALEVMINQVAHESGSLQKSS
jgi:mannan endo-1,6-alpha-mannosidase